MVFRRGQHVRPNVVRFKPAVIPPGEAPFALRQAGSELHQDISRLGQQADRAQIAAWMLQPRQRLASGVEHDQFPVRPVLLDKAIDSFLCEYEPGRLCETEKARNVWLHVPANHARISCSPAR